MKKVLILVIFIIFSFISCSTKNCVETYMTVEKEKNKGQKTYSVLHERKGYSERILKIYAEFLLDNVTRQAKSFNQKDYDFLHAKYKNDSVPKFWKQTDVKLFRLDTILKHENIFKKKEFKTQDEIIYYVLSNPIFINKNHALFSYAKSNKYGGVIDNCVLIMKRKNGKWVFFEKVYTDELQ
ncbi:hypothetical protein [Flavobacterium sp.]|uniref:hypothetical protein n=1 Tax=Flavobacterium sp. TaxID=239 RepID=UPI003750B047